MSVFLGNNLDCQEGYSVEEISYDDMMSILSAQKHVMPKKEATIVPLTSANRVSRQSLRRNMNNSKSNYTQDIVQQRIADNAKKQLPTWLLHS
jgi:hypothetical protein